MQTTQETSHINLARFNMIEQQIRPWDVLEGRVLKLLSEVPREQFVPPAYAGLAFADIEIPLGTQPNQAMLSPKLEGRILHSLNLKKTDTVLQIGTGSGYLTALLAHLAAHVTALDVVDALTTQAREKLATQGIDNVRLITADGVDGDATQGSTYDVIVYTASSPTEPQGVRAQLNVGGRMFVVLGQGDVMQATLMTRVTAQHFNQVVLFETQLPALNNAPILSQFKF